MNSALLPELELTGQQMEMLELLCADYSNGEIALAQGRSITTVAKGIEKLARAIACKTRVGVAVWWVRSRSALYVAPTPGEKARAMGAGVGGN